jgi:hypothetical protein
MSGNKNLGLRNHASSPASIANNEHHDPSGSKKVIDGSAATIREIIADSTTKTPLEDYAVLRVTNTTGAVEYLFVGKDSDAPAGVPTILNGMAFPAGHSEMVFCGVADDNKESIVCKASVVGLQVIIMYS